MTTLPRLLTPEGHLRMAVALADASEVIVKGDRVVGPVEYEAAFPRLHRRAYDVAFKLLGSRAEAEDVAQEALARAFVHWSEVHPYAEAWTVRVAGNLAIGTWRKRRRLTDLPVGRDGSGERADRARRVPEGHPQHHVAEHVELRRAIGRLSRRQREVVVLRHLAGFSERETAQALGCSDGTVKAHSSRGLASLRRMLAVVDDERPAAPAAGDGAA